MVIWYIFADKVLVVSLKPGNAARPCGVCCDAFKIPLLPLSPLSS